MRAALLIQLNDVYIVSDDLIFFYNIFVLTVTQATFSLFICCFFLILNFCMFFVILTIKNRLIERSSGLLN
jgi:hypothetical protein